METPPALELRPFQAEAIRRLQRPGHVICVAATGSGKSLIYERLAQAPRRRTLLVTPLIALARQQGEKLRRAGVQVAMGTGASPGEVPSAGTGAWIVSPEALLHPSRQGALRTWAPDFLVVDECHCLWEWGRDFRPAFARIPEILSLRSLTRSLWLTATLPLQARGVLRDLLLDDQRHEIGAFALPSSLQLSLVRMPFEGRIAAFLDQLGSLEGHGIVFAPTREMAERLMRLVRARGRSALVYHAGLSVEERRNAEALIRSREVEVVVATSAFGMGMDYAHLSWCILWQAPPTLLSFAQAIGRVGRSGSTGRAIAFWDLDDFRLLEWMIQGSAEKRDGLLSTLKFFQGPGCKSCELIRYFEGPAAGYCSECLIH